MEFSYLQCRLRRYTFTEKHIRRWVEFNAEGLVLNLFAGTTRLDCQEVRNDIREEMDADYHMDALEFVKSWEGKRFDTVLLDPPYAYRKSMTMYDGAVSSPFNQIKDHLPQILKPRGIVITFGYHSVVMGKKRNFKQEHLLLMSHGGAIHDTIAVIERKQIKRRTTT